MRTLVPILETTKISSISAPDPHSERMTYLLNICHALHSETDGEDYQSSDITARSKGGVVAASGRIRDGGGVQDDGWKCCDN
jgi:hypothetical protein